MKKKNISCPLQQVLIETEKLKRAPCLCSRFVADEPTSKKRKREKKERKREKSKGGVFRRARQRWKKTVNFFSFGCASWKIFLASFTTSQRHSPARPLVLRVPPSEVTTAAPLPHPKLHVMWGLATAACRHTPDRSIHAALCVLPSA